MRGREGGKEGGREGGRERGREGGKEGGRERGRETEMKEEHHSHNALELTYAASLDLLVDQEVPVVLDVLSSLTYQQGQLPLAHLWGLVDLAGPTAHAHMGTTIATNMQVYIHTHAHTHHCSFVPPWT